MKKTRFAVPGDFTATLHSRIDTYFNEKQRNKSGDSRIFRKLLLIVTLLILSYTLLFYVEIAIPYKLLALFLFAQANVLMGFNVMHDGNHGSFSSNPRVNAIAGRIFDIIGGSSFLWKHKHNVLHHTYTNIAGCDDDLETEGFIRLSPRQTWKPFQRYQHIYALPLYAIMTLHWFFVSDIVSLFTLKMGESRIPGFTKKEKLKFIIGKLFYLLYMIVIPLQFNSLLYVIGAFLIVHMIASITLSVVFQLAHTLEVNDFPKLGEGETRLETEWSLHQLNTTSNFAPHNPFVTWYMGGLNYQIEHHLFPKMSHVHYADISEIVQDVCREFGYTYNVFPTVRQAFANHMGFLKKLGVKPSAI